MPNLFNTLQLLSITETMLYRYIQHNCSQIIILHVCQLILSIRIAHLFSRTEPLCIRIAFSRQRLTQDDEIKRCLNRLFSRN